MNPFAVASATFEFGLRLAALPFEVGARILGVGSDDEHTETRPADTSSPSHSRDSGQARGRSTRSTQQRRSTQASAGRTAQRQSNGSASDEGRPAATPSSVRDEGAERAAAAERRDR
jgi:hypothetical protein